jgi:hypothetical protein
VQTLPQPVAPTKSSNTLRVWDQLSSRTQILVATSVIAVISGGLALDARWGWAGQHVATLWTLCVWIGLYRLGGITERKVLIFCTLIAAFGEIVLSLAWGIYDYQFHNVPLFVPPGHALLMTLGVIASRYLTSRMSWIVLGTATGWCIYTISIGVDSFGAALFGVFAFCMIVGRTKPQRSLYATMFVLALLMELYGTSLGNWVWQYTAPGTPLNAANPPFSAGAFYCLLDLLVLSAVRITSPRSGDIHTRPAPSTTK